MADYTKCAWCGRTIEKSWGNKFLSHNTMGLAGKQKDSYCSTKCEKEAEAAQSGGGGGNNSNSQSGGGNQGGGSSSGGGFFSKMNDSMDASNERRESKIESRVDSIVAIKFGSTADEISDACNQMVTIAAGKPDKEVKKAIYEKMEFAIMKLRQLGANAEADFFEKKRTDVKPKWYD
ncbi:MAG: hypothetical protein WCK02_12295 [Bacteroidota bacterium]